MSKLVIEVEFDDKGVSQEDMWEIESVLSGLISEEFLHYGKEYPEADIKSFWKDE